MIILGIRRHSRLKYFFCSYSRVFIKKGSFPEVPRTNVNVKHKNLQRFSLFYPRFQIYVLYSYILTK